MNTPAGNTVAPAKTILLVEDDPAVCYFLGRVLHNVGYFVGAASDGISGLRVFRTRPWDVVITDRMMAGMDGEELASEIKNEVPSQPIVLLTGLPSRIG